MSGIKAIPHLRDFATLADKKTVK